MNYENNLLWNDKMVAYSLCMSPSWVRGERYKRRHSLPHQLDIDPVLIGSKPLYVADEIRAFIANRKAARTTN